MGCQACRQSEPEETFLPYNEDDIKNLDKQNFTTTEKKEDYNKFIAYFENNLSALGNYFQNDFTTLIPPKILEYITENPFSLNQELLNSLESYEMKPVEFTNGNVYQGGWNRNLKMEGQGKYYLKEDGVLAEGIWKEGNLFYARVFITKDDDSFDIYEGNMKYSKFNGKGKLIQSDGQIYEGDFEDGEKNGICKIIYKDGTLYEGQIEKDILKGKGKMLWKNGYEYEGNFDKNKFNGNGILKGPNKDTFKNDDYNNDSNNDDKYKDGDEEERKIKLQKIFIIVSKLFCSGLTISIFSLFPSFSLFNSFF